MKTTIERPNATEQLTANLREAAGYDFNVELVDIDWGAARDDGRTRCQLDLSGLSGEARQRWEAYVAASQEWDLPRPPQGDRRGFSTLLTWGAGSLVLVSF